MRVSTANLRGSSSPMLSPALGISTSLPSYCTGGLGVPVSQRTLKCWWLIASSAESDPTLYTLSPQIMSLLLNLTATLELFCVCTISLKGTTVKLHKKQAR
eukprot:Pompholyxophrys_punicea_v1_NODE_205_length_2758_cov_6.359230.p4 type:complete len:101 gc:universal NODE_205_length_2758_cov_6.359230:2346-2044(-)